ncbi:MAG: Rpn family recombination-promoting nuclease/putative transposase, partial [Muribaculaceae bacterium]|nr:Rpn family recombination-promoting nuclease/putative transposase [Muribaculaceae bacterium]
YFCRGIAEQGYKGQKSLKERREDGVTKQADLLSDDSGSEKSDMEYTTSEKLDMEEREYWDYDFIPVVGVIFSNFFIKGLDRKLVTFMKMTDSETHKPIGDFMHAAFIQLPAFDKRKEDCKTLFDEWMYNLTHMATMETMAFTSHQDIFNRLAKVANLATLSPAQRRQYDYDLKKARDYHNEMKFARKEAFSEGEAKGIAIGEAKGIMEGTVRTARNLKSLGASVEMIVAATGLSQTEVEAL